MDFKQFFLTIGAVMVSMWVAAQSPGNVIVLKNAMNSIVSGDAKIEKLADGFLFIEGPLWHPDGYLLFSDIPANKIMKYVPGQGVSVYLENSGFVGSEDEITGQGSNGLTFDLSGNLIICQHGARQILKADLAGNFTPLARQFGGKRLNSPNDVVVKSDGTIFFTDPPWGLAKGVDDPAKELDFQGVFILKSGNLTLLDNALKLPNGLAFSPDEKYLYVTDSDGSRKLYYRYELAENGMLKDKQLFFDASELKGQGGPDGIKVDSKGNCYFTGPGGVLVINPKGEHIGTIAPPEVPANLAFGGKDGKTLFMTCRTGLYAIELKVEGILPWKK
ncbi:MAG: SMP-30/gluconolactonase/LRE family protein [Cyclobacteriaceae bacterium]|nr:SMP-30/gluconolactonase/LRE family protein [Cyclobacteriaceae bacterium]